MTMSVRRCVSVVSFALLALTLTAQPSLAIQAPKAIGKTVPLQKGSVDGLAGAIAAAGPGGTVIVLPGNHFESHTVTITTPVSILGKRGAVILSTTTPDPDYVIVDAALHVKGASGAVLRGLELRPTVADSGNTAIVIEDASDVQVAGNTISGYQGGVLIQNGDRASITGNTISASFMGVVDINGADVQITNNRIADAANGFAIWACDLNGQAYGNMVSNSFIGIIACNVPPGGVIIGGVPYGSLHPGTNWAIHDNFASDNLWGYLVIDGANHNTLTNNAASGSGVYDMELTGDTERFGFFTPGSYDNTVNAGNNQITIKDCGVNNTINGGIPIDTTADPCY